MPTQKSSRVIEGARAKGISVSEIPRASARRALIFLRVAKKSAARGIGFWEDFSSPKAFLAPKPYADTARGEKAFGNEKDPKSICVCRAPCRLAYSNVTATISDFVPSRNGDIQVPTPLEV